MFLLYSPLNQGLKHHLKYDPTPYTGEFLLYSPLNQGLKPNNLNVRVTDYVFFFIIQFIKSRNKNKLNTLEWWAIIKCFYLTFQYNDD